MNKIAFIFFSGLLGVLAATAQPHNRAIGTYPGNPEEYYGPELVEGGTYRNLALHRTVWQSSSWDFNLTGQLLTDGVIETRQPTCLTVSTPEGILPIHRRESAIDGNDWTCNILMGNKTWLQYDWQEMPVNPDEVELVCTLAYRERGQRGFSIRLLTSENGKKWQVADQWQGDDLPGTPSQTRAHSDPNKNTGDDLIPTRNLQHTFHLNGIPTSHLRLELSAPAAVHWTVTELQMRKDGKRAQNILPATQFSSAWRSLGGNNEWVTIDLGAPASIDLVRLHWLSKPEHGNIWASSDNTHWHEIALLPWGRSRKQEVSLRGNTCRYLRFNFSPKNPKKAKDPEKAKPYCLTEIEVMGTGGITARPHTEGGWNNGRWLLNGGDWRLQRASLVNADGPQVSSPEMNTDQWLTATVPATVLSSHVNAGALPDMNHDDNLLLSSESYFNGDFWYRRTFDLPSEMAGRNITLNLDGINWKADVWLNGKQIGRVEGAFQRGKFDITPHLRPAGNVLAIRIQANANPGGVKLKTERNTDYNGGVLGADNPTFHATVGWDWISTIRGRDIGIWDDVCLTASGDITLADPVVTTTLAQSDTLASLTPAVMLTNHASHAVSGTLSGYVGDIRFSRPLTVAAGETIEAKFTPAEFGQLRDQRLPLWWPNGYGTPYLHEAGFTFTEGSQVSDSVHYLAGIRQVETAGRDTCLRIWVNHRRLVPLGGNWAFSENNLNYRGREYDAAVRHHREMNYNMIRNWVGMTGDREFYEACDRYGIMVWQDFWLANPVDGPNPDNEPMFMDNATDLVKKIRRHPSIGIYCGRNEGYPPKSLDTALRQAVATWHPGLDYISSSADDGVSGHGPYYALPPQEYFTRQTGKLHTERGMPCVMTYEGLSRTLTPDHLWPQSVYWGRHDFTQEGAQRGKEFNRLINENFGEPTSAEEFTQWAQWINLEGYRAMYESGSGDRMGLLIWMSHPCWPSMVWQTYDYYLEPTAAYFGVKHACEPLHVQHNPVTNRVEVVNRSAGHQRGTVTATIVTMDGTTLWTANQSYDINEGMTIDAMTVNKPQGYEGVYLLRLTLTAPDGKVLSSNDYVYGTTEGDRKALRSLRETHVQSTVTTHGCHTTITLTNNGSVPAMMLRLNLLGSDGEQILPVIYSDNYLHLLPGEQRTIQVEWKAEDTRGTVPVIQLTGTNVPSKQIGL